MTEQCETTSPAATLDSTSRPVPTPDGGDHLSANKRTPVCTSATLVNDCHSTVRLYQFMLPVKITKWDKYHTTLPCNTALAM